MRAPYCGDKNQKRKVLTKKDLMREMYACKECDCESYPWCSYLGGLCRECVDLNSYTHKRPLRNKPGEYSVDESEIKKSDIRKIDSPHITVIKTKEDGGARGGRLDSALANKLNSCKRNMIKKSKARGIGFKKCLTMVFQIT